MKIKVIDSYIGLRTQSQRVLPGVYEIGSPYLYGCEQIMVDKGFAEYVDDDYAGAVAEVLLAPVVSSEVDVLGGWDADELPPEVAARAIAAASEPEAIELDDVPTSEPEADEPIAPRKRGKGSK